jgi:hypothetical protein
MSECLSSNLLTTWRTDVIKKTKVIQLVSIFPAFYGTRRFITVYLQESAIRPYPEPEESSPHPSIYI